MNQDYIKITGLQVYGFHGVFSAEKEKGQTFVVNAKVYYDMSACGQSDRLKEALNYAEVCLYITKLLKENRFDLVEAAANFVCEQVLIRFDLATKIELELCKPSAPIPLPFDNVSINMTRTWHRVFLSIGSNMGDKRGFLEGALEKMRANPRMKNFRVSDFIATEPYGVTDQDSFLNGAIELYTLDSPNQLLDYLHRLEAEAGRVRTMHWGPRTLDLDILFYDNEEISTANLIVPHIDMENRDFVLEPMAEIAPGFVHPVCRKTMKQMLEELKNRSNPA